MLSDIYIINEQFTFLKFVEPGDKACYRGLAGTSLPYDGNILARFDVEVKITQHRSTGRISEVEVFEIDFALDFLDFQRVDLVHTVFAIDESKNSFSCR